MSSPPDRHQATPPDAADDSSTARPRGMADWYYLGFLAMLLFQPIFDPDVGVLHWVLTGLVVVVFVPLYLVVMSRPGRLRRWAAPIATLLAFGLFAVNGGATVLLVYAAAFVGSFEPRRVALRWFGGLSLAMVVMALLAPVPIPFALPAFGVPMLFIWLVGMSCIEDAEKERAADRLRIDNARIEHLATAAERERIARDLHDVLGQALTEVIVRAQLVRRLADADPARAAEEAGRIEDAARRSLDEVRASVRGWREVRLDDELEVARRALAAAGMRLSLERDPAFDPPPTTETALALAVREAVTNVIRHAGASCCTVVLRREQGHDVVEIGDDGRGLDAPDGGGLTGMRERILALGGSLESTAQGGTTLTIRVPTGLPA